MILLHTFILKLFFFFLCKIKTIGNRKAKLKKNKLWITTGANENLYRYLLDAWNLFGSIVLIGDCFVDFYWQIRDDFSVTVYFWQHSFPLLQLFGWYSVMFLFLCKVLWHCAGGWAGSKQQCLLTWEMEQFWFASRVFVCSVIYYSSTSPFQKFLSLLEGGENWVGNSVASPHVAIWAYSSH